MRNGSFTGLSDTGPDWTAVYYEQGAASSEGAASVGGDATLAPTAVRSCSSAKPALDVAAGSGLRPHTPEYSGPGQPDKAASAHGGQAMTGCPRRSAGSATSRLRLPASRCEVLDRSGVVAGSTAGRVKTAHCPAAPTNAVPSRGRCMHRHYGGTELFWRKACALHVGAGFRLRPSTPESRVPGACTHRPRSPWAHPALATRRACATIVPWRQACAASWLS